MSDSVGNVVIEASRQLNDQNSAAPYARWTQLELVTYLSNGLAQIAIFRPDLFTVNTNIVLVPGAQQSVPTGYSLIKSIDANGPSSNCPGAPISEGDIYLLRSFYKQPCQPTGGVMNYRVVTFSYDPKSPTVFFVSPPVPVGVTGFDVTATAVQDPPVYGVADITANTPIQLDRKYHNALTAWMLFEAYRVDTESESSTAHSQSNLKVFATTLGVDYKQLCLYLSGWYLGQIGLKDPHPNGH